MTDYDLKPEPDHTAPTERRSPGVLPYRSPADRVYTNRLAAVPAALGFLLAAGGCAGAFVLFASTYDASLAARRACFFGTAGAFMVLVVIRYLLQQRFGFSGFGRGMLVGALLGLCALFPCAGLYALTLLGH
jgi:hypothetical protein